MQAGVDAGAEVATGGRRPDALAKGYFYEPTVLTGVTPDSPSSPRRSSVQWPRS